MLRGQPLAAIGHMETDQSECTSILRSGPKTILALMRNRFMLTLVIYDISDDKKRTRLSRKLISYSMERIQYSAFKGELNSHDRFILAKEIEKYLSKETDSIYIIPLCERCFSLVDILSESNKSLREDQIKVI